MVTQKQFDELMPKKKSEITCKNCSEKWKHFHKCEKDNQPERSKREDSNLVYVLFEVSQIHPKADRMGEVFSREEAEKWVGNNPLRCWHEHFRDAVL